MDFLHDVRFAARGLARTPAFTAIAIVTLALGIGFNTAIFSVVDAIVFRPLPYPDADRLVRVFATNVNEDEPRSGASLADFDDWRAQSTTLERLTTIYGRTLTLTDVAEPESVGAMLVGPDFSALFGTRLALGRFFGAADFESPGNADLAPIVRTQSSDTATVIISHALWHRQFAGDPQVPGRSIRLNGKPAIVVGVMDEQFSFDETPVGRADVWVPLVPRAMAGSRRFRQFVVVGRLAPGVDLARARAEMTTIASTLERAHPRDNAGWGTEVTSLHDSIVGDARRALLVLLGAVAFVLLIACANIANLVLMRAVGRAREVSVRVALGAGRVRLVRGWLAEALVLCVAGSALGLTLAYWLVSVAVVVAPENMSRMDEITIDGRVLAFTALLTVLMTIVCGLTPAITGVAGMAALRSSIGTTEAMSKRRLRQTLVLAEVALTIVLLVGAGLMVRTLIALRTIDLGFEPDNVMTFGVDLRSERYRRLTAVRTFGRDLVARLDALPGVEAAGVGGVPLLATMTAGFRPDVGNEAIESQLDVPTEGYFRALGIRMVHGRALKDSDRTGSPLVAVVNQRFARLAWGTDDVIGRRLRFNQSKADWMTVVGIAADIRMTGLEVEPPPVVYVPYEQSTIATFNNYVVRTSGDPRQQIRAVREVVRELDASLAVSRLATMEERLSRELASRAFNLWLSVAFAAVAFALAIVGVYGLISDSVARRTKELGVRIALGAERRQVLASVLGQALSLTSAGILIGLASAAAASRYLHGMVFGIDPLDATTFTLVAITFLAVSAFAAWLPARRATRIDPVAALRTD